MENTHTGQRIGICINASDTFNWHACACAYTYACPSTGAGAAAFATTGGAAATATRLGKLILSLLSIRPG